MTTEYNFDTEDTYVPFTFKGNEYRFYYPTLEQTIQAEALTNDDDKNKAMEFMFGLVKKPEGAAYPDFSEVRKEMNLKQTLKFREMLETELGLETK